MRRQLLDFDGRVLIRVDEPSRRIASIMAAELGIDQWLAASIMIRFAWENKKQFKEWNGK